MPGRGALTYATPAGHALIDRALYLPADWAGVGVHVNVPSHVRMNVLSS